MGGDLFELEHVTTDTIAFARRQLERPSCPCLLISGNHDYASPASPYRTSEWPESLTLALEPSPTPLVLPTGTLWGFGYSGRELEQEALAAFALPSETRAPNILVAHGTDLSTVPEDWRCLGLVPEQVQRMGFDHALMGHIHTGSIGEWISFPGAPVPLGAAEAGGLHGALWVEAEPGRVRLQHIPCPVARYVAVELDVDGLGDASEVEAAAQRVLPSPQGGETVLATLTLGGRRAPSMRLVPDQLAEVLATPSVGVRVVDATRSDVNLEELAREPNARGKAISRLLIQGSPEALAAAALLVDAFEGDLRLPA